MDILERITQEIHSYEEKIKEYRSGIVDPNTRGLRAVMGVYPEREAEKYMTRIKTPGGIITTKQLEDVGNIADRYSHGKLHFTTRQDIQFQGVELENTVKIMKEALEIGIDTLGAGGNSARNVACSPLSGVDKEEIFDVTPYALKAAEHLQKDPSTLKLPRKYKVSFSNNNSDTAYATIADLGFVAKTEKAKKGFEVYGAGGLGGSPTKAIKLEDFIEASEVLYYVEAMKELFYAEGDRENRNKARIRYIVYRLGEEKFRELFNEYVAKVKKEHQLNIEASVEEKYYHEDNSNLAAVPQAMEQKQKGYYWIFVHPLNGYLKTEDLRKIINYIKALDYEVSIRLSNTQGFYIRDIKGKDVERLLEIVSPFTTKPAIERLITCVGETVCGTGLCNSQGLAESIYNKLLEAPEKVQSVLPRIFISGCPNSCGQHQIGKLGFSGKAIKGEDGMIPAYRIYFGGAIEAGKTRLGEAKGEIPARNIPDFLYELAVLISHSQYSSFDEYIQSQWNEVEALIEKYKTLQKGIELYYDFGAQIKFLIKR